MTKTNYVAKPVCEICGKNDAFNLAIIEGAKVSACANCSRFGSVIGKLGKEEGDIIQTPAYTSNEIVEEIIEDAPKIIRDARTRAQMSIGDLATRLREQAHYLEKIEKGQLTPSLTIARKLEKVLHVTLVERTRYEQQGSLKKEFVLPTLEDLLKSDKKKK
ncbi:MAG: multiprotein-bridging factor 1 family protein [Candidatus Micrarchaeota archaeon]